MESEKKTKLSRNNESDLEAEFRPFIPSSVNVEGKPVTPNGFPVDPGDLESSFGLPDEFWGWINSDASLRREFEKYIELKSQERIDRLNSELKAEITDKARKEGLQKGLEEARTEIVEVTRLMNETCAQILREKETVLHSHEKIWCRAFSHLLKRFLVPNDEMIVERLHAYLGASLANYSMATKVKVHLAASDYERLAPVLNKIPTSGWQVMADWSLQSGQIHCEFDDGGLFFSPSEEYKKLQQWIEQTFPGEVKA